MRRHISMEQLAHDVLTTASEAVREKHAAEVTRTTALRTGIGQLLSKVATEVRNADSDSLSYADIAYAAEVRLGQR